MRVVDAHITTSYTTANTFDVTGDQLTQADVDRCHALLTECGVRRHRPGTGELLSLRDRLRLLSKPLRALRDLSEREP